MNRSRAIPKTNRRNLFLLAAAVLVIASFLFLASESRTLSSHANKTTNPSLGQVQQQAKDMAASKTDQNQKTSQTGSALQPGSGGSSASGSAPTGPNGQFVSAHNVPSSSTIVSVCNTSVGATCQVSFTKLDDSGKGTIKSLSSQAVDSTGSTNWSWTVGSLLSSGSWSVKATSTLNGQTSSTEDVTNLVVQ